MSAKNLLGPKVPSAGGSRLFPSLSKKFSQLQIFQDTVIQKTDTGDVTEPSAFHHEEAEATLLTSSCYDSEREKWISSFINLLPDPVALLNKEGEIVYMNSRFHSITNVPLTNGPFNCSLLDLLHDRDKADVLAGLHKSFALKDIVDLAKIRCYSYYDRETHSFPIECSLVLSSSEQENMVLLVMKR